MNVCAPLNQVFGFQKSNFGGWIRFSIAFLEVLELKNQEGSNG
jgi:hypothetical protein